MTDTPNINTTTSFRPRTVGDAATDFPAAAPAEAADPAAASVDPDPEAVDPAASGEDAPEVEADPEAPRDETHDSIDPQTGALHPAALAKRASIMDDLRAAGHTVENWAMALEVLAATGVEMAEGEDIA